MDKYLKDLKREYNQIIWPTRKEMVKKTILVIALSVFLVLLILLFDLIFMEIGRIGIEKFQIGG